MARRVSHTALDPLALGALLRHASDAHVSMDDVLDLVGRTPGLAEELVRVGSSELFDMPGKITRPNRAVLILGPRNVAAIAAAVFAARPPSGAGLATPRQRLAVGLCAELIARQLELAIGPEAWAAGLLHDLGARALDWGFPESLCQALAHQRAPLEAPLAARGLASVLHAAHLLVGPKDAAASELIEGLGLFPEDLVEIEQRLADRTKELARLLEVA